MKKKFLVIGVVAGLDLAFIFLMGGGLSLNEVARVSDTLPPPQPYIVLTREEAPFAQHDIAIDETEKQALKKLPVLASHRKEKSLREFRPERTIVRRQKSGRNLSRHPSNVQFADTVIWVKRHEKIEFTDVGRDRKPEPDPTLTQYVISEPKKRSFISKAVPIVKKPYDWIKELVSKLK